MGLLTSLIIRSEASERFIRYAASLILHLAFGHRVNSTDDKYVQISETAVTGQVESGNPCSLVVDFFPAREFSSMSSFCFQAEILNPFLLK